MVALLILLGVLAVSAVVALVRAVTVVPPGHAGVVERFGRYRRTLPAGRHLLVPAADRVRHLVDLGERRVSSPHPVITEDDLPLVVEVVVSLRVTDPVAATYEVVDVVRAVEQLATTTVRNVVGGLSLEEALTSRAAIDAALRGVLDEATGRWGVRVARVEVTDVRRPPPVTDPTEEHGRG